MEYRQSSYILCIPIQLRNKDKKKTYTREKYIFNIALVVPSLNFKMHRPVYNELIRKITYFFTELEVNYNLIYLQTAT